MKLIVISPPLNESNEHRIINKLFEEGLTLFHLRKPETDEQDIERHLRSIDNRYHDRIVLHNHFDLSNKYKLSGIHFREDERTALSDERLNMEIASFKSKDMTVSTSVHNLESLAGLNTGFDYTFIGPVFDSISKSGVKANTRLGSMPPSPASVTERIALGGVSLENIEGTMQRGFDGVALLGAIWNEGDHAIDYFKKVKRKCQEIAQKH
ncbi:thiamine phosphate synthase [Fulvivirgaceae bacterium BMA10]|uniref:Thiamine phosphate synthase n=1 Tax=Splendidivirga corallicola TaxID=3051826 RepID=A0ABT8KSN7_9BACT|nr:thiamine phosphate synthase [Fulvivirgaceae bacterium BMA10]